MKSRINQRSLLSFCVIFASLHYGMQLGGYIHTLNKDLKDKGKSFDSLYTVYSIPKKNSGNRLITVPCEKLKLIQKNLSAIFERALLIYDSNKRTFKLSNDANYTFELGKSSFGFEKHKNIIMNAEAHKNNSYYFKTDIKKFFNSFDVIMVKKTVKFAMMVNRKSLFNQLSFNKTLSKQSKRTIYKALKLFDDKYINYITALLCYNGKLATGSPTSPALCNLYMRPFDLHINVWLKNLEIKSGQKFTYTRYADDICISSPSPIPKKIITYIEKKLKEFKLEMNVSKTVLQTNNAKNVITGINVTKEGNLTVGRKKKEEIKKMLYSFLIKEDFSTYPREKIIGNINFLYTIEAEWCTTILNKYFIALCHKNEYPKVQMYNLIDISYLLCKKRNHVSNELERLYEQAFSPFKV